ncbi:MAG: Stp1/IreP family PP2C-type Ser/Thr phosphatase [Myxococcaceae bacterium]
MRIEVAGKSHVGMKRNINEDSFLVMPDQRLYCVADGMGGHFAGEIASRIAIDEIAEFFRLTSSDRDMTWPFKMDKTRNYDENRLATGIKLANARIYEAASGDPNYRGMGTTIATVHFADGAAYVGHVGDSRVYRFRSGKLELVTEDHSLLNDYLKAKKLSPEEIEAFPHKNVIVRALGMKDTVQVDVARFEPGDGDLFLLCSDGLSGMVSDTEMEALLGTTDDLDEACTLLIERANAAGGNDNVTCILARCRLE